MGMCRWMGSHFHNWIEYRGCIFNRATGMGLHIFRILGIRKFWQVGISGKKNVKIRSKKWYRICN